MLLKERRKHARPRAGDWVEVKSADEILATLDEQGRLDGLPFMPEMLQYCGKRLQVFKSAHKSCDTIQDWKTMRSMRGAVHLAGARCDGASHGGCQAACLLYWKEAWLKPVGDPTVAPMGTPRCDEAALVAATRAGEGSEARYRCQATDLPAATTPIARWSVGHYVADLTSRNVRLRDFVRYALLAAYNSVMRLHWRLKTHPYVRGLAGDKTPTAELNLQPGELVRVRSHDEIMRTLNQGARNRGLSFDVEMVPYCGKTFRVLRRVDHIVNEKTGRMIRMPNACLILEGAVCGGCLSHKRMFCPRAIYPYWHEVWLDRVEAPRDATA